MESVDFGEGAAVKIDIKGAITIIRQCTLRRCCIPSGETPIRNSRRWDQPSVVQARRNMLCRSSVRSAKCLYANNLGFNIKMRTMVTKIPIDRSDSLSMHSKKILNVVEIDGLIVRKRQSCEA